MRLTFGIVLLSFMLSTTLHAQPDSLLHVNFAKRSIFLFELNRHVTGKMEASSAVDTLNELIAFARRNNDPAFATQLEFEKYTVAGYLNQSNYHQELEKIQFAVKEGHTREAAEGYQKVADWMWEADLRTEATTAALQAYEIYKSYSQEEFPPRRRYQHRLAIIYYDFRKYEQAKHLLLELAETGNKSTYEALGSFVNTLALIYQIQKKYDSAIYYLKALYRDEAGIAGPSGRDLAAGNIGRLYYLNKQYDSALLWLKSDLATSIRKGKGKQGVFPSYIMIAKVYLAMNELSAARLYIDSAKQLKYSVEKLKLLIVYFDTYVKIMRASERPDEALTYMDTLALLTDSIAKQRDKSKLIEAEKNIADAKTAAKILKLENARDKSVWLRNFSIALIVFISVITLLLINRSRMRHKAKELQLENEKNLAVAELAAFTLKLSERNQRLSQLEEEINELTNEQEIASRNEIINELRQSTILTDEEWDRFRTLFEKVHGGYIQKVKDRYSDLTPAEVRYITLTKLGMTNKEMANVLGISTNTVRNYKFRLRKKFDLSESDDLDAMIKSI